MSLNGSFKHALIVYFHLKDGWYWTPYRDDDMKKAPTYSGNNNRACCWRTFP